jgi:hypothetical protein
LIDRLVVAAPWACDRSGAPPTQRDRALFDRVVSALAEVRAGRLGVVTFERPAELTSGDPLIGPARVWQSRTHYRATRHAGRRKDLAAALIRDVIAGCARRGLPRPEVEIIEFSALLNRRLIIELAAKSRLPTMSAYREYPEAGGLMSYGSVRVDRFRRAGIYAAKILKGAKPTDLPVELPTNYEFVINLKTARSLNLEIPRALLLITDEVME